MSYWYVNVITVVEQLVSFFEKIMSEKIMIEILRAIILLVTKWTLQKHALLHAVRTTVVPSLSVILDLWQNFFRKFLNLYNITWMCETLQWLDCRWFLVSESEVSCNRSLRSCPTSWVVLEPAKPRRTECSVTSTSDVPYWHIIAGPFFVQFFNISHLFPFIDNSTQWPSSLYFSAPFRHLLSASFMRFAVRLT